MEGVVTPCAGYYIKLKKIAPPSYPVYFYTEVLNEAQA